MNTRHWSMRIACAAVAFAGFMSPASAQNDQADRLPMFGDLTFEEKWELLGEFSAEEVFGLGTEEYARAARKAAHENPCTIQFDPERGAGVNNTWPDGIVPYAFSANVSTTNQARAIAAMDTISAVTPVVFIPRTTESAFIVFNDSNSNNSPVGRQGGGQTINMFNWTFRFIICHEIMHSLGIWHEQQRPDRDEYVQINFGNVQNGTQGNFTIPGGAFNIGDYDFESVMHYGQCDFTTCGSCNASCRTITVLPPNQGFQNTIGQRDRLSDGDIETINFLYGGGRTVMPISDNFDTGTLNESDWFSFNGAAVNAQAINEPSGSFSLNIGGSQFVRSLFADARLIDTITLNYKWQRTGNGNSPEAGDDLVVEYFNDQDEWVEINRHLGSGPDMTVFEDASISLPADAQHNDLRVRFTNISVSVGADEYFVDDVEFSGLPASPGAFAIVTPADGAVGVNRSPLFQWTPATATVSYRLLVDNNEDFSSPNLNFMTTNPNFSNPGFQLNDGIYFWKVIATNPNGETTSNPDPATFRVGLPAVCPGDCDGSGTVDFNDLVGMLFAFGPASGANDPCDAQPDGTVDFNDLVRTLFLFGPCD